MTCYCAIMMHHQKPITYSDQTTLNVDHQVSMTITYANITRFCENVVDIYMSDLHTNFVTSNVIVNRILAVVFTFWILIQDRERERERERERDLTPLSIISDNGIQPNKTSKKRNNSSSSNNKTSSSSLSTNNKKARKTKKFLLIQSVSVLGFK